MTIGPANGAGELVVITGASRGIGKATAWAFHRRGLRLALLGRLSETLERTEAELKVGGASVSVFRCDVTNPAEIRQASVDVLAKMGTPLIVVNNAATISRGPTVAETSVEDWDRVMATNLRGPFLISQAFLPAMLKRDQGRFIAVSSISGTMGCKQAASYGASKWGLTGFAKSLAEELRGTGLCSLAVLPGSVDTEMLVGSPFSPDMTAEDIAKTIVFAALDAPRAMNGSAIEVFG